MFKEKRKKVWDSLIPMNLNSVVYYFCFQALQLLKAGHQSKTKVEEAKEKEEEEEKQSRKPLEDGLVGMVNLAI